MISQNAIQLILIAGLFLNTQAAADFTIGVIPDTQNLSLTQAGGLTILEMNQYSDNVNQNVDVYEATSNSWAEGSITYNNAPGTTGGSLDFVNVTTDWKAV